MPETSYLTIGDSGASAVPAAEQARLIREYGFEGASLFLHPCGTSIG
jgi:hypothetical protein